MSFEIIETDGVNGLLEDAKVAFDGYRAALLDRIKQLEADDKLEKSTEINRQLADLHKLLGVAVDLTRKVEDARIKEQGGLGHGALDLEAARSAIRGRVARLRAAGGAGGVAGGDDAG